MKKNNPPSKKTIIGAGGGGKAGGKGRVAVESPDDLRSRAFARIIDLISEGEIEGLVTGDLKSVYLDGTRVENDDGTQNFTGVTAAFRNGTQGQSYIPGFEAVESEQSVGLQVTNASGGVVHSVSDTTLSACRVTIGIPQLTKQNTKNGDIGGSSVQIAIDVKPNGGSYTEVVLDTIQGKTTTRYQRSYRVQLTGTGPWDIRVRRVTPDSVTISLQDQTWWDSFTEIKDAKLTYPNSALAAMVIDSKQFANIPTRGYDVKLLRTQIPSNATVNADGSLSYSGSWDGEFIIGWHANPAWVFYDMLTNGRYGIGDFITDAQVDKWTLYTIGRYCDEQVPNGFGGFEPRFTCNIYFQQQAPAFKVLQDLASVFRGMIYWSSGLIVPTQDSPAEPVMLYTKANIIGKFTRSGTALDTRHSVALVTWNDPADFFTQKIEYVEDAAAISRYGVKQTQVVAVGCTSRGQANRVGKWLLYSEANDTELISFKCGIDSMRVRPGQVMAIQDSARAGARLSGRIKVTGTSQIEVDRAFTPSNDSSYTLMVMMPDGTVATSEISSIDGPVLYLETPLAEAPVAGAIWMVRNSEIDVERFRVVGITDLGNGQYEISGLQYNGLKYAAVEQGLKLTPAPISLLNTPPDPPSGIQVTENLYERTGGVAVMVSVAWVPPARAISYIFSYQRAGGNIITYDNVATPLFEIDDAVEGQYTFTVVAVGPTGKRSAPAQYAYEVVGKTAKPADVQNFTLVSIADGVAHLSLSKSTDLDVLIGGFLRVRWTPEIDSPEWYEAVDIGQALPGITTNFPVPHVSGSFLAKFVDSSGNASENAAVVSTNIALLMNSEQVTEMVENPGWAGVQDGVIYIADENGIAIAGGELIDDILEDIDEWSDIDFYGGIAAGGYYYFENEVDFGAVYNCLLRAHLFTRGFDALALIDLRVDLIDDWVDIDGQSIDDVNAEMQVSISTDMVTWSDYVPFFVAQYLAQGLKFRLALTTESSTHTIIVEECAVTIDIPDRTEQANGLSSGTSTYHVTFGAAFFDTPGIAITAQNMVSGDYYQISNADAEGFDIDFYNSSGTHVNRNFNYLAKGQGYRST